MLRICMILLLWYAVGILTNEEHYEYDPYDMVNPRKVIKDEKGIMKSPEAADNHKADPPEMKQFQESPASRAQRDCTKADVGKQLLKNYVKSFLKHFELKEPTSGSQEYSMILKLSFDEFKMLHRFVLDESSDLHSLHDVNDILTDMIQSVSRSHLGTMGKISVWFEDKYGASIDAALKMVAVLLMASVFATLEMKLQMSWRQRFLKLIVLAFIVSIPMTWFELYKAEQIKQQTVALKDAPADCVKNDSVSDNWFGAAFHMLSSIFTLKEDKCQKYYEHMMIDPFVKVPPTKAVGVTFVRFFLSPLKDVGASLSTFIRELLIDLPVTLYPVAMFMVIVFFFLILFMTFGYSFKLPFFLSIEPSPYHGVTGSVSNQQTIEDNTKRLMEQIQTVQETLESREAQFTARLNDFERLQKSAIEYSASVNVPDMPCPTVPASVISKPAVIPSITPNIQYERHIFQESGDADTLSNVKSPIPCSDVEINSSTEEVSDVVNLPHPGNSKSSPGRSSKLPISNKGKSSDRVPTQVSSASRTDSVQTRNLTALSPDTLQSQEAGSR